MTTERRYTFTAIETHPDGTRIAVVITVPADAAWTDVREMNEVASMTASRGMSALVASVKSAQERCPF